MTASANDPLLGRVLADNFRVLERIGSGGMGSLYKGLNLKLDQVVALKFVHRHLSGDLKTIKRFSREARLLAGLHHPNIVSIRSFHMVESGEIFLVMEYLEGETLAQRLKRNGTLSREEFDIIFEQVCAGLTYAHEHDVIHRDVKPENIMLVQGGSGATVAKLLDFGLARHADVARSQSLTASGALVGSFNYVSPEQCMGKKLDERTDVYALACTMWESLSGKTPYDAPTALLTMQMHMSKPLPPLDDSTLSTVSSLLQNCTAVDPSRRPPSVAAVWNSLSSTTQAEEPQERLNGLGGVQLPRKLRPVCYAAVAAICCWVAFCLYQTHLRAEQAEAAARIEVQRAQLLSNVVTAVRTYSGTIPQTMDAAKFAGVPDVDIERTVAQAAALQLEIGQHPELRRYYIDMFAQHGVNWAEALANDGNQVDSANVFNIVADKLAKFAGPDVALSVLAGPLMRAHFHKQPYLQSAGLSIQARLQRQANNDFLTRERLEEACYTSCAMLEPKAKGYEYRGLPPLKDQVALCVNATRDLVEYYVATKRFTEAEKTIKKSLRMIQLTGAEPSQYELLMRLRESVAKSST